MKRKLHILLFIAFLLLIPNVIFGQAPNICTASTLAICTCEGAFDNHRESYPTTIFANELNAGSLQTGIYYYVISDNEGVVQSGKLISK